ncbi:MAG: formylglycine-generating enzyme family protein [Phaeodactylibacter xiamenensis]|uniref:formylglycine-generating enzyme family protein n=1 Tax=Phaeodactylibacter xiamenensis TaxID=1524460 RepID=UPI000696102D|nr:formylglycine-generating enzyme family protein [Phaeodactylibacter xiamenensis]MCR9054939.1 formylglycine-generating enzyme family protein [bacterium]
MPQSFYIEKLPDDTSFEMVWIEGGEFMMGSTPKIQYLPSVRKQVRGFYMAKHLVTQSLWYSITGENPSFFKGENQPVEQVSWYDVQAFLKALNKRTEKQYRLPTEAEWEFAAIGGVYAQKLNYAGSNRLKEVGWYDKNSQAQTHPVGLKFPNQLGLYDMSGNVWEWCVDHRYKHSDGSSQIIEEAVARGGSWLISENLCHPSNQTWINTRTRFSHIGFRLALFSSNALKR